MFEPRDTIEVRLNRRLQPPPTNLLRERPYISTLETFDATPTQLGDFAIAPSNRIVDVLTSLGGIFPTPGKPFSRQLAITPGRTYEGTTRDWGISGQVDWTLGSATLTSITAYRGYKATSPSDTDYSNVDILFREDNGQAFREFKTFTQELRLQGAAFNDKLDWLIGAYYASEDLHVRDNLKFGTQYGAFAACRLVATVSPVAVLRNPAAPGCLSAAATALEPFSATGVGGAGPSSPGLAISARSTSRRKSSNYCQDAPRGYLHPQYSNHRQLAISSAPAPRARKEFRANSPDQRRLPAQQAALHSDRRSDGPPDSLGSQGHRHRPARAMKHHTQRPTLADKRGEDE